MPLISYNQLKKDLSPNNNLLSPYGMAMAVSQLTEHATEKGREFHCLVIDRDNSPDELEHLLADVNLINFDTRFQIVYRTKHHWSTMDVQIKNGQINFFLLDAANSLIYTLDAMVTINKICPRAQITYCPSFMQRDTDNCAYFALDDAYNLSRMNDLHEEMKPCVTRGAYGDYKDYCAYIEDNINTYSSLSPLISKYGKVEILEVVQQVNYISCLNLPKSFGAIIKNIQSLSTFSEHFSGKGYYRLSNHKSVDDYVKQHTENKRNNALLDKKNKIKESTLVYMQKHQHDYQAILATRQQLNKTISLPTLINLQNQINQMASYAHKNLKNTTSYQTILDLAKQLTERTQNLRSQLRTNQNPNPIDLVSFKKDFISLLHANDSLIKTHRKPWKVVVANLLLALTGVGALVLACQSIAQQRLALFFNKTRRERHVEDIEGSLKVIQSLPA
ncbi:MAG: hypothetical protein Q8M40_14310 [Legionella sp.]|nr:hypothetical protein [Legionella sp.]